MISRDLPDTRSGKRESADARIWEKKNRFAGPRFEPGSLFGTNALPVELTWFFFSGTTHGNSFRSPLSTRDETVGRTRAQ